MAISCKKFNCLLEVERWLDTFFVYKKYVWHDFVARTWVVTVTHPRASDAGRYLTVAEISVYG